ncbi:hypothetical protein Hamer_G008712 [Homarus americanus]|uniref:Uncharacterized protein n=1 Tax=Homarus americanus TaxID=6706 RepID=A0A8J5T8K4_HOMAM|nr:hypothetical protein Hamer_G008712 [Homarus americanus]
MIISGMGTPKVSGRCIDTHPDLIGALPQRYEVLRREGGAIQRQVLVRGFNIQQRRSSVVSPTDTKSLSSKTSLTLSEGSKMAPPRVLRTLATASVLLGTWVAGLSFMYLLRVSSPSHDTVSFPVTHTYETSPGFYDSSDSLITRGITHLFYTVPAATPHAGAQTPSSWLRFLETTAPPGFDKRVRNCRRGGDSSQPSHGKITGSTESVLAIDQREHSRTDLIVKDSYVTGMWHGLYEYNPRGTMTTPMRQSMEDED